MHTETTVTNHSMSTRMVNVRKMGDPSAGNNVGQQELPLSLGGVQNGVVASEAVCITDLQSPCGPKIPVLSREVPRSHYITRDTYSVPYGNTHGSIPGVRRVLARSQADKQCMVCSPDSTPRGHCLELHLNDWVNFSNMV